MEIEKVYQGRATSFSVTLFDVSGAVYTGFTGDEALTVKMNAGEEQAPLSPTPNAVWTDAPNGLLSVTYAASTTINLTPGRYYNEVVVTPSGQDPVTAVRFQVDVIASAGTATSPSCYSTYQDLLNIYPLVVEFQTLDDQSLFANQRHAGHEWINRNVLNRYGSWLMRRRSSEGYYYAAPRLEVMKGYLDADDLVVDDTVKEIEARYALYLIMDTAFTTGKTTDDQYAEMSCKCRNRANELLDGLRVRITDATDGVDLWLDGDWVIRADRNIL